MPCSHFALMTSGPFGINGLVIVLVLVTAVRPLVCLIILKYDKRYMLLRWHINLTLSCKVRRGNYELKDVSCEVCSS